MEIQRDILPELRRHLEQKEISLVIGPRQAGKTTILRTLLKQLQEEGHICLYFNLDIDTDAQYFTSQHRFLERVDVQAGRKRAFVFIDEVQRIENAGLFLKGLYDRELPYKFIATGSGSLELKEKIAESLVGRKQNFYLYTVSINEFIRYRTKGQARERLSDWLATDPILENQLLLEYLTFGGYPRVVTATTAVEKNAILSEIFQGYIERDIKLLLQLEKSRAFVTLLQILANRAGKMANINELAKLSELSVPTVKNYLWYSEKTFITTAVTPFFRNREKEIVKSPQYYFLDSGLRNFLIGLNQLDRSTEDMGFLFQQMVFRLLQDHFRDSVASIHFWRTQTQAEVDFVVNRGRDLLPVEVKSSLMDQPKVGRSLHSFLQKYQPAEAWVINRQLDTALQVGNTKVYFRPWRRLLE
ncbi:MAG: ATP-binding protein [Phaeodactylibacter sp.]|nr:ATP-binding protein [Phaeodactylibacter sp.]MCB9299024.1 ATP-binding protein [Lewinellaceae bacterium]HQU59935.1 ATP-binding protein [Saprospiraceae bacterium]